MPVPDGTVGTSVVLLMVRDAYANYVVQTTLDVVADEREKHMLMEELYSHSSELVRSNFELNASNFFKYGHHLRLSTSNRKTILLQSTLLQSWNLGQGAAPHSQVYPHPFMFYNDNDSSFDGAIFR